MKTSCLKAALFATATLCLSGAAFAQSETTTSSPMSPGASGPAATGPSPAAPTPGSLGSGTMPSGTVSTSTMSEGQVRQIQQALKANGHDVTVDGQFGTETQTALRSYQQSKGMTATGQADAQTLAALGISAGSVGSSTGMNTGTGSSATGMGANNPGPNNPSAMTGNPSNPGVGMPRGQGNTGGGTGAGTNQ